jgi:hypothetical protein
LLWYDEAMAPTEPAPDGDDADAASGDEAELGPADDGMAPLITNTGADPAEGDDADAASG